MYTYCVSKSVAKFFDRTVGEKYRRNSKEPETEVKLNKAIVIGGEASLGCFLIAILSILETPFVPLELIGWYCC